MTRTTESVLFLFSRLRKLSELSSNKFLHSVLKIFRLHFPNNFNILRILKKLLKPTKGLYCNSRSTEFLPVFLVSRAQIYQKSCKNILQKHET